MNRKKIKERIYDLIRKDSFTITEICEQVDIDRGTYYKWLKNDSNFAEEVSKAEDDRLEMFKEEARKSLLKKVQGYTVEETKTLYVDASKDKKEKSVPKIKEQTITKKHIQPDTAAIIFTLCNTDPDNWKNRQSNEITGVDGKDLNPSVKLDITMLTDEERKALLGVGEKLLNKKEE